MTSSDEPEAPVAAREEGAAKTPSFQPGGALHERAFYIEREVDARLYEALRGGRDAYIVSARQVGKTSLAQRTARRLADDGALSLYVDLDAIGVAKDESQWLHTLARRLLRRAREVDPSLPAYDIAAMARAEADVTPWERFSLAVRDGLLAGHDRRVVLVLDEIGATLRLTKAVRESFCAFLRAMRADAAEPCWRRLTVCLVGVVRPDEVVEARDEGFFAHAMEVTVDDLTRPECDAFRPGIADVTDEAGALLDAVYEWTSGHPAFTQKVLHHVALLGELDGDPMARVEAVVRKEIIGRDDAEDPVLGDVRNRFQPRPGTLWDTLGTWNAVRPRALALYRSVLVARTDVASSDAASGALERAIERVVPTSAAAAEVEVAGELVGSRVVQALRVTGLVSERRESGRVMLRRRNRIYATVFNVDWVDELLKDRPITQGVARWEAAGRSDDRVLRGSDLQEALRWSEGRGDLSTSELAFLEASIRVEKEENLRTLDVLRAAQDRKLIRWAIGFVVMSLAGLLVTATLYVREHQAQQTLATQRNDLDRARQRAANQSARAEQATAEAYAREALGIAPTVGAGDRAIALAANVVGSEAFRQWKGVSHELADLLVRVAWLRHRQLRALSAHEHGAFDVAFTTDGTRMVTVGGDRRVKLWDVRSGEILATLLGHSERVSSVYVSADGTRALSLGQDHAAHLWSLSPTGGNALSVFNEEGGVVAAALSRDGARGLTAGARQARVWDGHTGAIVTTLQVPGVTAPIATRASTFTAAALSADGAFAATGLSDGAVLLWDASSGGLVTLFTGLRGPIESLRFSADGRRVLATAAREGRVWSRLDFRVLANIGCDDHDVGAADITPDGTRVVLACDDHVARLWIVDDRVHPLRTPVDAPMLLRAHNERIRAVHFSDDGLRVVTAGADREAKVWDARSGQLLQSLVGHTNALTAAVFAPDGDRLATASADGTVRLWDTRPGAGMVVLRGHEESISAAALSADGARVVTTSPDETARVWDVRTGLFTSVLRGHNAVVVAAVFSPDGTRVVTGGDDLTARIWDVAGGTARALLDHRAATTSAGRFSGSVQVVAWSPAGDRIVTATTEPFARLWASGDGRPIARLQHDDAPASNSGVGDVVIDLDTSRDGRSVALAGTDGAVSLWDAATGARRARWRCEQQGLRAVRFSPDGTRIVTVSDTLAQMWDVATGRERGRFIGHQGVVNTVAFSADGLRVVTASSDGTARVWDARGGDPLAVLTGHTDAVASASFSADGSRVVTASIDGTARVWSSRDGALLATLQGHRNALVFAAFTPDGTRVVTASQDTTARVWDVSVLVDPRGYFCGELRWMNPLLTVPTWRAAHPAAPEIEAGYRACGL